MGFTVYVHNATEAPAFKNVTYVDDGTDPAVEAWVCDPDDDDYAELEDMLTEYGGSLYPSVDDAFVAFVDASVTSASPAWTRKEGKNRNGGLNDKGRKSYPGHLKRPQAHGKRHNSFCARFNGMKKRMKNKKKKNDPNSRINLALRKWKC